MATRFNKNTQQKSFPAPAVPVKDDPSMVWTALESTKEVQPDAPSPFAGRPAALSKAKPIPVSLTMWAMNLGINPKVFDEAELNKEIQNSRWMYAFRRLLKLIINSRQEYMPEYKKFRHFSAREDAYSQEFVDLLNNFHLNA